MDEFDKAAGVLVAGKDGLGKAIDRNEISDWGRSLVASRDKRIEELERECARKDEDDAKIIRALDCGYITQAKHLLLQRKAALSRQAQENGGKDGGQTGPEDK